MKGSWEKIVREYGLQPKLLKGEVEHPVINKTDCTELRHNW